MLHLTRQSSVFSLKMYAYWGLKKFHAEGPRDRQGVVGVSGKIHTFQAGTLSLPGVANGMANTVKTTQVSEAEERKAGAGGQRCSLGSWMCVQNENLTTPSSTFPIGCSTKSLLNSVGKTEEMK